MKRKILLFTLALISVCGFSQTISVTDKQKFFDNTYISINGGVATPLTNEAFWKDLNANLGIRLGKEITPIFGVAIGTNAYFSEFLKQYDESSKAIKYLNTTVLAKVNILNCFGYKEDRKWNLSVLLGPGWGHSFVNHGNTLTANMGINVSYDIIEHLQVYLEPSLIYDLQKQSYGLGFDIDQSVFQINLGLTWRFGKTKFSNSVVYTKEYVDDLNDKINALYEEANNKIVVTEFVHDTIVVTNEVYDKQSVVTFRIGSDEIEYTQETNLLTFVSHIEDGDKIEIFGYADQETGSDEINTVLAQKRAESVKNALVGLGINGDDISASGRNPEVIFEGPRNRCATIFIVK